MALIKCMECGAEISDKALACVKCGAPVGKPVAPSGGSSPVAVQRPKMRPWAKWGLGFIVSCFVFGVAFQIFGPTDGETATVRSSAPAQVAPALQVSADTLFLAYQANEVAADDHYKGRTLEVTGTVQSINKDITDDTYLQLATENEFMGIRADLKKQYVSQAASLTKGQPITVMCRGDGMLMGSPILRDCAIAPSQN